MKKLDERKKGFEGKFARDQELEFKILARRNKYLGVWAAEKLGISGPAVEEYFAEVVKSDLEEDGDMDVFRKVRKDFDDKGISVMRKFWGIYIKDVFFSPKLYGLKKKEMKRKKSADRPCILKKNIFFLSLYLSNFLF